LLEEFLGINQEENGRAPTCCGRAAGASCSGVHGQWGTPWSSHGETPVLSTVVAHRHACCHLVFALNTVTCPVVMPTTRESGKKKE